MLALVLNSDITGMDVLTVPLFLMGCQEMGSELVSAKQDIYLTLLWVAAFARLPPTFSTELYANLAKK